MQSACMSQQAEYGPRPQNQEDRTSSPKGVMTYFKPSELQAFNLPRCKTKPHIITLIHINTVEAHICVYICIQKYTGILVHTYIHTYIHTDISTCVHAYMRIYKHTYVYAANYLSAALQGPKEQHLYLEVSWLVISRVISRITTVVTHIEGLITLLTTTHKPPSTTFGREPHSKAPRHAICTQ